MITSSEKNKEIDQDRVFDLFDTFDKYGCAMFRQQQSIYKQLALHIAGQDVLEAGCGSGVGTAILNCSAQSIVGTDKLQRNVDFARAIYPWITFATWDLNKPTPLRASTVVCIEAIEHVADTEAAIKNLIDAAKQEVWFSVPNGIGKAKPPDNPYHVCEPTPQEVLDIIGNYQVTIRDWKNWSIVSYRDEHDTSVDPLVYHVHGL